MGFQQINGFAGQYIWLDAAGIFFAQYFEYVLVFCLILFLFLPVRLRFSAAAAKIKKNWHIARQAIAAALVSRFVFTEIIRYAAPIQRPFVENDVNLLINHINSHSFPSGHAAFYFALSAVVFYYYKKAGISVFVASFLICLGRVFCGIHWPMDIAAGAVVGIFSAWLVLKLWKK